MMTDTKAAIHEDNLEVPPPAYTEKWGYSSASDAGSVSSTELSPQGFHPTRQLDVQAIGYDYTQALTGSTLENIAVSDPDTGDVEYTSIRLKRSSNSCALVRGSSSSPETTGPALISTIYRWGPGRGPKMRILPRDTTATVEAAINDADDVGCRELVDVKSRSSSLITRSIRLETTTLGVFEWRYASRSERKQDQADSLLVLEKVITDITAGDHDAAAASGSSSSVTSSIKSKILGGSHTGGKKSTHRVRVAQLVRNAEFRTALTTRYMGGNGGRLVMDLSMWSNVVVGGGGDHEKQRMMASDMNNDNTAAQDVEAFVVAGCICMLKREADRFKDNMIATVV